MLKITKASQPIHINQIVLCIYSLPGIGKTTLAFTADKPLLLDFDNGSYRAGNRKDVVEIASWQGAASINAEDLADYNTVIIDTAGRSLDYLSAQIIDDNPKNARGSGDLTLQGYGVLKGKFITWLKALRTMGKDVVLISHMDEKMEGDVLQERLDVAGGSKSEIYKSSDAIGKLYIDGKTRKLDFSPRQGSLGKNPAQFDVLAVPDFHKEPDFLAHVIRDIKGAINRLSDEQKAETDAIEGWRKMFGACKTAADFNGAVKLAKDSSQTVKMLLMAEATAKGMKWDKEGKEFYAPAPATAPPPTETSPSTPQPPIVQPEPSQRKESLFPEAEENLDADPLSPAESGVPAEHHDEPPSQPKKWLISEANRKRMFAIASKNGVSEKRLREIAGSHGFEHLHEITPLNYPKIVEELELIGTQA